MLNILIVDDHYVVGEGTKNMLEKHENFSAHYVSSGEEALALEESFDIYIIDIQMSHMSGIELSKKLLEIDPDSKIILYTGFEDQASLYLFTEIGISGIISKTSTMEELLNLVENVLSGNTIVPLSIFKNEAINKVGIHGLKERDLVILKYVAKGINNKDIAKELFISDRTVEYRLTQIYKLLGVQSRSEAVNVAVQKQLIKLH